MPDHTAVRVHLVGAGEAERLQHSRQRLRGPQVGLAQLVVVAGVADRRRVATGVGARVVPVGVGDRFERRATGPADHRRAELVAEGAHRVEREVAQQAVEPVDVRVQRLAADPEARRQPGQGQRLDSRLVDQLAGRLDDRVVVQSHLGRHVPPCGRHRSVRLTV